MFSVINKGDLELKNEFYDLAKLFQYCFEDYAQDKCENVSCEYNKNDLDRRRRGQNFI